LKCAALSMMPVTILGNSLFGPSGRLRKHVSDKKPN